MTVVRYLVDGKKLAPDEPQEFAWASVPCECQYFFRPLWRIHEVSYPVLRLPRLGAEFHIMGNEMDHNGEFDAFEVNHGNWFKIKVY